MHTCEKHSRSIQAAEEQLKFGLLAKLRGSERNIWIPFGYHLKYLYLCKNIWNMTVISIRDFRSNQSKYLNMASNGESVILTSRSGSFRIVPVSADDSVMTKAEFEAKIEAARAEILEGKGTTVNGKAELNSFLEAL